VLPAAHGDAEPPSTRSGGAPAGETLQDEWTERPPQRVSEGAAPPRSALGPRTAGLAESAPSSPIATKVLGQVAAGRVVLRGQHSEAVLRAALMAAARGLTVLGREPWRPAGE
jgi:hypothetical protein